MQVYKTTVEVQSHSIEANTETDACIKDFSPKSTIVFTIHVEKHDLEVHILFNTN